MSNFTRSKPQSANKRLPEAESNAERPSSSIFERLSQPIIRKFRSTTGYLPGVVYDEKKDMKKDTPNSVNLFPECDKIAIKPRVYSEINCLPTSKPLSHRNTAYTLKDLLIGRPASSSKIKNMEFAFRNKQYLA
jgi:hypothetical protein